jgi:hypothetical protein
MFHFKKSRNKYDGLIACPYCGNTEMNTGFKIGGHLKACPVRYISISNTIEVLSTTETDKLEDVDFNDFDEDDVNYNLCGHSFISKRQRLLYHQQGSTT